MILRQLDEQRQLDQLAGQARRRLGRRALDLEQLADQGLTAAGVGDHPLASSGITAAASASLTCLLGRGAGPALRRGGRLALGALRWSRLLG